MENNEQSKNKKKIKKTIISLFEYDLSYQILDTYKKNYEKNTNKEISYRKVLEIILDEYFHIKNNKNK